MAEKEVYMGSAGPFLFEDDDTYEDGKSFRGVRSNQVFLDDAPSADEEAFRQLEGNALESKLDSKAASLSTMVSGVDSEAESAVLSNADNLSEADSAIVSNSVEISGADSKADSNSTNISGADSGVISNSAGVSEVLSATVSNSINISVADSKGDSGGNSEAISKVNSNALNVSEVDSAVLSNSLNISGADSKVASNSMELSGVDSSTDSLAVTQHTQGTDTALGVQTEDLDMNSHQVVSLSVPDAAGEAIRQTAKITEAALETLVDDAVLDSDFDANTILAANVNDTPLPLTVAEDRIVGRASGGNIAALTPTQTRTIQELDSPLSPTVRTGGEVTEGTNAGTLKVAASTAWFRTADLDTAPLAYATKDLEDNIAITDPNKTYIVVLNYNSGSPTISLSESMPDLTMSLPIGQALREVNNTVHYISGGYNLHNGVARLHMRSRALRALELGRGSGGSTIVYSGVNNFVMNTGIAYGGINDFPLGVYNSATTTFTPIYRDGSGGYTKGVARKTIDFAHYDDGTPPLGSVASNRYSTHWVYRHIDDDHIFVVYGRGSYKLAEAEAELEPTTPDFISEFGCLIGCIVAPGTGGSFKTVQMVTNTVFSGTSMATHNEMGGLNDGDDYEHITQTQKDALHTQGTDTALGAVGTKNPPIDADKVLYRNSASADALVTSTWTQVKAFLKTYFDTLYNKYVLENHASNHTDGTDDIQSATNAQKGVATAAHITAIEANTNLQHTQGTDTTLGTQASDINMGTHKLTALSVPSANGQSVRTTTKITEANLEDAVDKKHAAGSDNQTRGDLNLDTDDSPVFVTTKLSGLTDGKIPYHVNDATGLADGPTKTDVDDAVTKKHANTLDHTQGTDTALGTMAANINMNTHKLTSLSVPSSNGDSIRATTKITEVNLESAVDLKHSNAADHTQGTDTTLGTMTQDINMNNLYQVVGLQAPAAAGEAIRQTAKITEVNLEADYDKLDAIEALADVSPALPSDEHLVGYWAFDDGSGSVAVDGSGNGNLGTLNNMEDADWVDGVVGKCLSFDGVNEFVNCGHDASLNMGTGNFTLYAWIKTSTTGKAIIDKRSGIFGYALRLNANGELEGFIGDGAQYSTNHGNTVITDGVWHQIVGVRDGSTFRFYVDGDTDGTFPISGDVDSTDHLDDLGIGVYTPTEALFFHGLIDEPRIYNTALTPSEVKALYLYPAGNKGTRINARQLDGDISVDASGNTTLTGDLTVPNTAWLGIGAAAERLEFYTAGYAAFMGCNVGIGTATPGTKLDVNGRLRSIAAGTEPATGTGLESFYSVSADVGHIYVYDRDTPGYKDLNLQGGRMIIEAGGNVGINTTTPGGKLCINGGLTVGSDTDAGDNNLRVEGFGTFLGTPAASPAANTLYKDNIVKAWINFNGTGVIAINDSFNVDSITDNGVGYYTITWDTDFGGTTYCWVGSARYWDDNNASAIVSNELSDTKTGAALQIAIESPNATGKRDSPEINIMAMGDQ